MNRGQYLLQDEHDSHQCERNRQIGSVLDCSDEDAHGDGEDGGQQAAQNKIVHQATARGRSARGRTAANFQSSRARRR